MIGYRISIGTQKLSDKASDNERLLLGATIHLQMDGYGNCCELLLGDAENTAPKLLDSLTVELDAGNGMRKVFSGIVDTVKISATQQLVIAFDKLNHAVKLKKETSYENVDVDFVVKDIFQQADINAGTIIKGIHLAALVLSKNSSALSQLLQLAEWSGADVYSDGEGKVHFTDTNSTGEPHSFQFGSNIQSLELQVTPPIYDSVEVLGEGAASSQGAEKYYWLSESLSGVIGKALIDNNGKVGKGRLGKSPRRITLGAVRSGKAAEQVAENIMQALASRWVRGRMTVMGAPEIKLTDSIKISNFPSKHSAAKLLQNGHKLRVRRVRHTLDRKQGFITQVEF